MHHKKNANICNRRYLFYVTLTPVTSRNLWFILLAVFPITHLYLNISVIVVKKHLFFSHLKLAHVLTVIYSLHFEKLCSESPNFRNTLPFKLSHTYL